MTPAVMKSGSSKARFRRLAAKESGQKLLRLGKQDTIFRLRSCSLLPCGKPKMMASEDEVIGFDACIISYRDRLWSHSYCAIE